MAKLFNGNIALASAIRPTGAQPLDDRVVVQSISDLYDSFGTAIYEGMLVVVNDEDAAYILVDKTKVSEADGWKKLGDGKGSLNSASYTAACALATDDNLGQIIYVTESETVGEGADAVEYGAGPYIVTGNGSVAKLGTTTASGDLAADLTAVQGKVSTIESTIGKAADGENPATGLIAEIASKADDSAVVKSVKIGSADAVTPTDGVIEIGVATSTADGLMSAADKGKLDGIAEGAQVNVIETVKVNGTALSVTDKAVDITIDAAPEYTIAELTAEDGFAKTYALQKDGAKVGVSINIPKDLVISKGEMVEATAETPILKKAAVGTEGEEGYVPAEYYAAGKYMKLTLNNDDVLYIAVNDLVDVYTGSDYIDVTGNVISAKVTALATDIATELGLSSAAYCDSSAFAPSDVVETLIGYDSDTKDSDSIKGAKRYADALVADFGVKSVSGSNAISVSTTDGAAAVSLLIASGDKAGNVSLTQSTDGLKGDLLWTQYE